MSGRRLGVFALLVVVVGLAAGLVFTWVVWPTEYYDTEPADLRADLREDELLLVAASYAAHEDIGQARRRLTWLGMPDDEAVRTLTEMVDYHSQSGSGVVVSRSLSKLAYALGARDKQVLVFIITPTPTITLVPTETPTPTRAPSTPISTATRLRPSVPTSTRTPSATATKPTSAAAQYVLSTKRFQCRDASTMQGGDGLLAVRVRDEYGRAEAGVPVIVSWGPDEDKFFTGLKPSEGLGYADFEMQSGWEYTVFVSDKTGRPVTLSFRDEDCTTGVLTGTTPVWELAFERQLPGELPGGRSSLSN